GTPLQARRRCAAADRPRPVRTSCSTSIAPAGGAALLVPLAFLVDDLTLHQHMHRVPGRVVVTRGGTERVASIPKPPAVFAFRQIVWPRGPVKAVHFTPPPPAPRSGGRASVGNRVGKESGARRQRSKYQNRV